MKTSFETLSCKVGACGGEHCPLCQYCLKGAAIPEESINAGYYGDATHFSYKIGRYSRQRDKVVEWECPECKGIWRA